MVQPAAQTDPDGLSPSSWPHRIDRQLHSDATLRGALERVGELRRSRPRIVDVGFEADSLSRVRYGLQHHRKDLVAVREDVVPVAAREVGADERRQIAREPRIASRQLASGSECFLVLGEEQSQRHGGRCAQEDDECAADGPHAPTHPVKLCNPCAAVLVRGGELGELGSDRV